MKKSVKTPCKVHIKVGDMVSVLSGKDKKKRGRVIAVSAREGKALVSGINKVKKHLKARRIGDDTGIVEAEAPIYTCKLQIICPHCDKTTRVERKINDQDIKVRVCKKCKKEISSKR